jgi:photosystem II stability/assembly factor-like uncharacterized protein
MPNLRSLVVLVIAAVLAPAAFAHQQPAPVDAKLFAGMRWRSIGPYRGGRTRACAGVPGRPATLYIGVCNGGVWKSVDYGRTWRPVFDDQPTGSIGSIAVATSDPNVVYVGSGEGLQRPDLSTGNGIYKSTDAGATWTHLGLGDGQQIPEIAVDSRDPNRLFVAVLGHPYGPNAERGVFRSKDGGKTFEKVLFVDENTGASDVVLDPKNPDVVYAAMWESRQGPWENSVWRGTSGGVFKSTDGGATWRRLTKGLPDEGVHQADLAISASDPRRLYAAVATLKEVGIYRSDDAGESWYKVTEDARPARRIGGGDLPVPAVDPSNPDVVLMTTVVAWRSIDGGKTWSAFRGAPGGDDYQHAWIDPTDPNTVLMTSDQGAVVTVDGGRTWSSWYNQPTAQMYHVATDTAFPYRVCGGQQESGSACVSSRGDDGQITFREWHPVGAEEYGYVAPDPLDPDVVYGGKVTRYDRRTGQTEEVAPRVFRAPDYRVLRTMPLVFSPKDPHVLYFSSNTVWKTTDGGRDWKQISPDLTRETWVVPASVGKYRDAETAKPARRGVVYALAPSPLDVSLIWAGTDDGLVHVTSDGGANWRDVTPPDLVPWAKVSVIEASHFDAATAYAAVNTIRLDDLRPYIYRTRDGGKTWTRVTAGIPDGETVNAVREDPRRRGLLFASTEREVYVSFDDGERWQSLRLNMPVSSVRDIAIKNDDLIAATHGRGFWILDDITPLRQIDAKTAGEDVVLFAPQTAYRVRWNTNTDTPLPPDEPAGQNPPDGAVIDYYLGRETSGPVTIEILDGAGRTVRRYSSEDPSSPPDPKDLDIPPYWVRPPQAPSRAAGMHRFAWDLHYTPAPGVAPDYPISAIAGDTPPSPTSPWATPGAYTVRLTASGRTLTQPLTVVMDPRVKTPEAGLREQLELSMRVYDAAVEAQAALGEIRAARKRLTPASELDKRAAAIEDEIAGIAGSLGRLFEVLQAADVAPTPQSAAAVADRRKALDDAVGKWRALAPELR